MFRTNKLFNSLQLSLLLYGFIFFCIYDDAYKIAGAAVLS